jgi:hypothetical protein
MSARYTRTFGLPSLRRATGSRLRPQARRPVPRASGDHARAFLPPAHRHVRVRVAPPRWRGPTRADRRSNSGYDDGRRCRHPDSGVPRPLSAGCRSEDLRSDAGPSPRRLAGLAHAKPPPVENRLPARLASLRPAASRELDLLPGRHQRLSLKLANDVGVRAHGHLRRMAEAPRPARGSRRRLGCGARRRHGVSRRAASARSRLPRAPSSTRAASSSCSRGPSTARRPGGETGGRREFRWP